MTTAPHMASFFLPFSFIPITFVAFFPVRSRLFQAIAAVHSPSSSVVSGTSVSTNGIGRARSNTGNTGKVPSFMAVPVVQNVAVSTVTLPTVTATASAPAADVTATSAAATLTPSAAQNVPAARTALVTESAAPTAPVSAVAVAVRRIESAEKEKMNSETDSKSDRNDNRMSVKRVQFCPVYEIKLPPEEGPLSRDETDEDDEINWRDAIDVEAELLEFESKEVEASKREKSEMLQQQMMDEVYKQIEVWGEALGRSSSDRSSVRFDTSADRDGKISPHNQNNPMIPLSAVASGIRLQN